MDLNGFFLHQSCQQILSSVWVSHLGKRRDLPCSRPTTPHALAVPWWCSTVTGPSAYCSMNVHCGDAFGTAYFLIFLQFWGAVAEAAASLCVIRQIALRAGLEKNWWGNHIPRLCPGRSGRRAGKEVRSAGQTCCDGSEVFLHRREKSSVPKWYCRETGVQQISSISAKVKGFCLPPACACYKNCSRFLIRII